MSHLTICLGWGPNSMILKADLCDKGVFFFHIISQLRRPIEFKFSQVCYCMHMLRYTKWEDWSLTITKGVHCHSVTFSCCLCSWQTMSLLDQLYHRNWKTFITKTCKTLNPLLLGRNAVGPLCCETHVTKRKGARPGVPGLVGSRLKHSTL